MLRGRSEYVSVIDAGMNGDVKYHEGGVRLNFCRDLGLAFTFPLNVGGNF